MATYSNAGSTFKISAGLPATEDAAGYAALTYTEVGEVTDFGQVGAETNLVSYTPVGTSVVNKRKGSRNYGTSSLTVVLDDADSGQTIFKAAALSANLYSMLITTVAGRKYYFQGLVMGFPIQFGTVDDMIQVTVPVEVSSVIVEVAPV